jgi:hypothetical protein
VADFDLPPQMFETGPGVEVNRTTAMMKAEK